jgi:tRNA (guanine-N7-)-methyltransferase
MLPSNGCEQIFVHFPVPWDKKPQRRVISRSFLDESMRVLRVDGRLELRTDSDKYFWYALETFFSVPKVEVEVRKNEALEVTSKYEARWKRQEKDIYDVYVKCTQNAKPKVLSIDFNSFDRPEHKYILLDKEGCRYFVSSPVKTTVNFKAHQKIMEYFNV